MNNASPIRRRRATNVSLDPKLLEEARKLGINVSQACEAGLERQTKIAREAKLREELAPTIAYWNDYVEKNGIPLAKYRMF